MPQKCGAIASLDLVNIIIAMPQAAKVIFRNGVFTAQIQFVDLHHARLWGLFRHFEKPWQTQIGKVLFIRKQIGRY
jgi:hypothetical protein